MSIPPPAIVVTLPARTVAEARVQIEEARSGGADLIELRFDRFSPEERGHAADLFPCTSPLVATLRSRAEGGEGPDDPATRGRILNELARNPFRWIDVELARDFLVADTLLYPGTRGLIISSHRLTTPSDSEWSHLIRHNVPDGTIRKVVVPASVGQALRELIPALPPSGESPLVALTTGPSGPLLRAWSRRFGFPLVYASLPERTDGPALAPVEPSQIPLDRLQPYLRADGTPPLFAVVGHPVERSRSPALHSRWMRENGHTGLYVALDFGNEKEFIESLPLLVEGGFRGLNVTHPFKEAALEAASAVGPGAAACGVANTLTLGPEEIAAENTDLVAVLRRLEELRSSGAWDGESVGVIGAGGAARATLAAARTLGVRAHIWARRREASELLAREFSATAPDELAQVQPSLVVHATPVGRELPLPEFLPNLRWLGPGIHLLDWVYDPAAGILRSSAEKAGATYEDGSRLLVYQAAASYGIWWGEDPAPEQLAAALEGTR